MRIVFVAHNFYQDGGKVLSSLASSRYRAIIPGEQLALRGHDVTLMPMELLSGEWTLPEADVIVLGKPLIVGGASFAHQAKDAGRRLVFDLCDNHFDHPVLGGEYRRICEIADIVTASTEAMADAIRQHTGREALILADPLEGMKGEPEFSPRFPRVKLLWFGSPTNLGTLNDVLEELLLIASHYPLELTVVTTVSQDLQQSAEAINTEHGARLWLRLLPWSQETTWEALQACDAVIIPSLDTKEKVVKSPNRLLESLWAGRYVLAHPLPSYVEFADYAWIGRGNWLEGLEAALADPDAVRRRIAAGQEAIAGRFSAYEVGKAWEAALGCAPVQEPVRLNLGCGDKILAGYINVDIVAVRAGRHPDVLCDLGDLSVFPDNYADEILSVHVVEHFWRWEVEDILKEWVRVLKPGGRMVLECPNLYSACEYFLANPDTAARADTHGQHSMWVFYGDPSWEDPYMIHRWGYTPGSLAQLMADAGLVDLRQEPAQFKLREPRDMRITGMKPA